MSRPTEEQCNAACGVLRDCQFWGRPPCEREDCARRAECDAAHQVKAAFYGCHFYSRKLYGDAKFCKADVEPDTRYCATHRPQTRCADCGTEITGTYYEAETPDDGRNFPRSTGELIVAPGHHTAPCGWPCIAGGVSMDHARAGKPVHGRHSWGSEMTSCACGGS